jgi:NAD dependent epimerase/dehydratase family enzyme
VGLYLHYLELDNNKAVNITAPNPERMKDFCKKLAGVLGGASWAHVPAFVIKLILGEAAVTVLKGQNAIPKQAINDGYQFQYSELKEALQNIYNK